MALVDTAEVPPEETYSDRVADPADSAANTAAESETDELGERLLTAAAAVFAERGYDKAGVAEIARRAGVTTGAIYGRYPGKAELLVEAIDPHAGDELETLFADHHFQGRMEDILLAAGSRLVEPSADGPTSPSLLLESFVAARRHPDVGRVLRERVMQRQGRLTDIVEAAKSNGGIDATIDTESLVTFSHALGFGFLLIEALSLPVPSSEPWTNLIARLVDALGDGAVTPPTTAPPTATTQSEHQGETP